VELWAYDEEDRMTQSIFKDKVVVITGASSGIGRELAFQLAAQGALLSLAARNVERLESVRAECERHGAKAIALITDVSEPVQCQELIRQTVERFSRLDVLINNAGRTMHVNFEDVRDPSIFEKLMRVNYLGSVYCTYYALPYLKETHGRIVGISSLTGKTGVPTRSGYAASKHAMAGFFDSLRIELAKHQISVTMIYPGFVATAVREEAFGDDGQAVGKSSIRESEVMPVETCAQIILRAAALRKREVVMTLRGKIGVWLKLMAPGLVDRIARKAIRTGR
jgi:short-subunit dehydrogenase